MLRSEATASFACLELLLSHKIRITTESTQRGHDITIRGFNQKQFVQKLQHIRSPSSCAYPQYKYVYIYTRIQSIHAHGHELISGFVLADAYNLMLIFCIVLLCSLALVLYILCMIRQILKAALLFKLAV